MKRNAFLQWIPVLLILMLLTAGVGLRQRNTYLHKQNNELLLQNDSILSVNLKLEKEMEALRQTIDSIHKDATRTATFRISSASFSKR